LAPVKTGAPQVGTVKIGPAQIRAFKIGSGQIGFLKIGIPQILMPEIRPAPVNLKKVLGWGNGRFPDLLSVR
jgi:hypothetical protein